MQTMHLFAGVGGGLLADLILGHKPIIAVEWEPYACKVLRERAEDGWFPSLHVWEGDVRLFDPSEYAGSVDCIHAGFPCQDISVAGKQAGVSEGTRSGLYREVLRIAGIVRPRYLFLENVAAILSNGLGTVLADLAAMGYDCRWLCIRASDVGSPHGRDRWFALCANTFGSSVEGMDVPQPVGFDPQESCRRQLARAIDAGIWADDYPSVRRAVDDVPGQLDEIFGRLRGIGNAQVPMQAAVAYRLLGGE